MNNEWNLDVLYKGLSDPSYEKDMNALKESNASIHALVEKAKDLPEKDRAEQILLALEENCRIFYRLGSYLSLRQSTNTEDGDIMAQNNRLMKIYADGAADFTACDHILGELSDVDTLAKESALIDEYKFLLKEKKKASAHLLSNDVEAMISAMDMTGGSAWSRLQSYLTSTVKVDYDGKQITLTEVRNLAYSPDAKTRKAAYDAEIAAYDKIADSLAFSLNNIKNQNIMLAAKRGYESPLAMTLEQSRMTRQTLDAMMEAVEEYLPVFRKYLRHKGELLGHKNGLPFYDLFAPLGKSDKSYSIEEAKEYLIDCFNSLSPDIADLMKEAFENEWIDFYPRNGKEGGAFCAEINELGQSRILTNFDGTFSAVDTLAHELGHAFHNRQMETARILNQDYSMPVAETASTFNEVHLGSYALKNAKGEERLALLESDLREKTQCIVDIYSRYLFETAVYEKCQDKFLMAEDLKEIMLDCQRRSYGDGLDEAFLHPYMWACKSHYYISSLSFYNFPYTFGNLFAEGLYALYLKEGKSFIPKYKEMLHKTGCSTIEESGKQIGVDLTKKEFWENSLKLMAEEIEEFLKM
ncbi:MAG: M3 family oligoendopeptidase [Agathobacter sp.]